MGHAKLFSAKADFYSMLQNKSNRLKFDIVLLVTAIVLIVCVFIIVPKEEIRFLTIDLNLGIESQDLIDENEIKTIVDEFLDQNPGIKINAELIDPENTEKTYDLIAFDSSSPGVNPDAIEDTRQITSYINIFFYNISILEKAGFNRPPKNRAEFLDLCAKIKENRKLPLGLSANAAISLLPWFYQGNIRYEAQTRDENVSVEGAEETKTSYIEWESKGVNDTYEFFHLLKEQAYIDVEDLDQTEDDLFNEFVSGKCAMMIAPVSYIKKIEESGRGVSFSISTIPGPSRFTGRPVLNLSSWNIAVCKDSIYKQEAEALLNYFEEKRLQLKAASFAVPGNLSGVIENVDEILPDDPLLKKAKDIYEACEIVNDSKLFEDPIEAANDLKAQIKHG